MIKNDDSFVIKIKYILLKLCFVIGIYFLAINPINMYADFSSVLDELTSDKHLKALSFDNIMSNSKAEQSELKKTASLIVTSSKFKELAKKDYASALLRFSKNIGKLKLYTIDKVIWNNKSSQFGWTVFFNSAVSIFNKDINGFPIIGYYNPYSDTLLITIWEKDKNIYKIVDAEIIMGNFLHGNGESSSSTPLWLQDKRDYKVSLGLSVASTVLAFEETFSSVTYENWREKLKVLQHQEIINGLNYSGVSLMTNNHLLNILNYINPKSQDTQHNEKNMLISKTITLLSQGKVNEVLVSANETSSGTSKLLKQIPRIWFETLNISAIIPDKDGYSFFLSSEDQTNFSFSMSIRKDKDGKLYIKRIELIAYQHFYDQLKLRIEKNKEVSNAL